MMCAQVLVNKLEKEFPDFPAVFFPDTDRKGNLLAHVLLPTDKNVEWYMKQEVEMYTWIQKKWSEILKMSQADGVRESGGAREATLIDNDICKEYGLRGTSHAAAFMTKAAATVDGARLSDPDTGSAIGHGRPEPRSRRSGWTTRRWCATASGWMRAMRWSRCRS
jgi:hypothetical protein